MVGHLCDTPYCVKKHCENNGVCNTSNSIPICQCPKGFEGRFCETNIDDCVLSSGGTPCQHGGICIDGINRYDCNCTGTGTALHFFLCFKKVRFNFSGYVGLICEINIDECATREKICGYGRCIDTLGSYRCKCDDPQKCGLDCSLDNLCVTLKPCEQGACESKCEKEADYICTCEDSFAGKNCSETVSFLFCFFSLKLYH